MKVLWFVCCALAIQLVLSAPSAAKKRKMPNNNFITVSSPTIKKLLAKEKAEQASNKNLKSKPKSPAKKGSNVAKQIINGVAAALGDVPYQVALHIDGNSGCGGSLILPNWVITAAHCTAGKTNVSVRAGTIDYWGGVQQYTTEKYEHPQYNITGSIENDVALLKLPNSFTLSANIALIKMPSRSDILRTFENETVRVSGWGRDAEESAMTQYLNMLDTKAISNDICDNTFGSHIKNTSFCTSTPNSGACRGDSGGPLAYKDCSNTWKLVGLVSFGAGGQCSSLPQVAARVTHYMQWISEKVGQDMHSPEDTCSTSTSTSTAAATTATAAPTTVTTAAPTTVTTAAPTTVTTAAPTTVTTAAPTTVTTAAPTMETTAAANPSSSSSSPSSSATAPTSASTSTSTSTSTTTTITTTTPKPTGKTVAPKCSAQDFMPLYKCCKTPRIDLVPPKGDPKNKTCGTFNAKVYNSLSINKQQDTKFPYNFGSKMAQNLAKDACHINCHMKNFMGWIAGDKMDVQKAIAGLALSNANNEWGNLITNAAQTCLNYMTQFNMPSFAKGKDNCSGEALLFVQCIHLTSLSSCARKTDDKACLPKKWEQFDMCKDKIFITSAQG